MKVYQWFYWTSNPQFWEKSQPVRGAQKEYMYTGIYVQYIQTYYISSNLVSGTHSFVNNFDKGTQTYKILFYFFMK
jgi:hypothetical protein